MDRFNVMLETVAARFQHVSYVDLREVLPATKRLWANELHPKEQGFGLWPLRAQHSRLSHGYRSLVPTNTW